MSQKVYVKNKMVRFKGSNTTHFQLRQNFAFFGCFGNPENSSSWTDSWSITRFGGGSGCSEQVDWRSWVNQHSNRWTNVVTFMLDISRVYLALWVTVTRCGTIASLHVWLTNICSTDFFQNNLTCLHLKKTPPKLPESEPEIFTPKWNPENHLNQTFTGRWLGERFPFGEDSHFD